MKKYLYYIPLPVAVAAAAYLLKGDFLPFLAWWAGILIAGLLFLPAGIRLFKGFNDKGFLFSKVLGILAGSYLMWFLSSVKVLPFSRLAVTGCLLAVGIAVFILCKGAAAWKSFFKVPANTRTVFLEEALFFVCLLFWALLRSQKPEIYGLEKFMDFGFLNSILRSSYAPPADMWMAGSPINYYYFGQYVTAFMTALTGIPSSIAYNLMMAALFAFTFVLSFSLVFNVIKAFYPVKPKQGKNIFHTAGGTAAAIGGLLSAAAVSLGGNLHGFISAFLLPLEQKLGLYKGEVKGYWIPDATRYIGYNPPTTDKTIHEFPLYSFVVSDLHAHVINILFVLTLLALLFTYLFRAYTEKPSGSGTGRWYFPGPELVFAGFLIGIFQMANYWDFPIYFTVTLIIVCIVSLHQNGISLNALLLAVYRALFVFILSELTALPFTLNFAKIAGSSDIKLAEAHSPLYQLLVLWGCPLAFAVIFLVYLFSRDTAWKLHPALPGIREAAAPNRAGRKKSNAAVRPASKNVLLKLTDNLHPADIFALVLCLCAIGLVAAPEIVYIKDIYTGDYKRANTMFKLTYQAFILFGLSIGYIFARIGFAGMKPKRNAIVKIVLLVVFGLTMIYPFNAIKAWYGPWNPANAKGLDGLAFLEEKYPDDLSAIQWLNKNVKGQPVLLEADGLSYSDNCRISMATGLPTVVGWFTHEHLWRNDPDLVSRKVEEVRQVYEDGSPEVTRQILEKYQVRYIVIGTLEREKFKALNESKLLSLGILTFESPTTKIIEVKW